ncbi:phosphoserine phosphatase [Nicoletella semolina]|uniref:Phosphoserine phosphatase n=1 Tax=Nicoletella semolina TaxID=271160 RepID=A0A4R2N7C9_9PAST|nr:phosphoserine phosphatase SerB [Nicoletella semolina]MDH2924389.1 phosphoserine phosphatase SerB [Nicoletella semolina]TCP16831.1 phosphoserine phosphatase [Nicoletella semolina]
MSIYFLYSKTLSESQVHHFAKEANAKLCGISRYLDYAIAFFDGNVTACLRQQAHNIAADFGELNSYPTLSQAGLLVMDMDSTIIKIECIDEIAKLAGTGDQVSAITAQAMRGELDFEQSLRRRVATLKNAPENILQKVRKNLPLMDGFEQMVAILKLNGWKLAIASGGFDYFADYLKEKYQLDAAESNTLEICGGKMTGEVRGRIVDAKFKADTLQALAQQFNIPTQQWVAVGDGANDLAMLHTAALGVALHAKPKVQEQAKVAVNFGDLTAIALLLNAQQLFNHLGES